MALQASAGVEPIAGYQLLERLGTGGYGEVWKSTAPGGLTKAIKLVYGHMQDARAEQELKALSRIRDVRHPFLLSLERFEIVEGQLVIVTELADMSLGDRYAASRQAGQRGIPRDELLVYMRDAADALDYMSEQFGLQHLDIKPQNLLLVGGRIKVADFGLVKNLQGTSATATGGVTPIYASPEAFDGRVSKYSDQYSLAIVYQEMLTGIRPFPGTTPLQLAMQHTSSPPLLDPLPPQDRAIVARALAKIPDQRFATCREMVAQLLAPVSKTVTPAEPAPRVAAEVETRRSTDPMSRKTTVAPGLRLPPKAGPRAPCPTPLPACAAPARELSGTGTWPPASAGGLRPTLFVGVGGLACATLRRLRRRFQDRFGDLSSVPLLRLLLIDSDRTTFRTAQVGEPGEVLSSEETLLTPLRKAEHYRPQTRDLLRWLDRRWLYGIPRSLLTEGIRPLGRLALLDNSNELLTRLRIALGEMARPEARAATLAAGVSVQDQAPRVMLVASLAGGTGSGMLLDMAYALRQVLRELRLPDDDLRAFLLYATSQNPAGKELARVNACATLLELQHFTQGATPYPGEAKYGLKGFHAGEPPFSDGYLVHLGDHLDEATVEAATDHLAEFLYLHGLGAAVSPHFQAEAATDRSLRLRTLGMSRITVPRYRLAELAGDLFCHQLVLRWRGECSTAEEEEKELSAFQASAARGLQVEAVASLLYTTVGTAWREDPKVLLEKLGDETFGGQTLRRGEERLRELCAEALRNLDHRLGTGRSRAEDMNHPPTALEVALHDHAEELGKSLGRSVIEWFVALIEDPRRRQVRAADHAARWLVQHLFTTCETLRGDMARLAAQREGLRGRLAQAEFPVTESGSGRWFGLRARPDTVEPRPAFLDYGLLRLRELVLENTHDVLRHIHAQVTSFTQDVARSLQKLRHFADSFAAATQAAPSPPLDDLLSPGQTAVPVSLPNVKELLPENARTIARAAESLFHRVAPNLTADMEAQLQAEVLTPLGGLWSIVSGPRELEVVLKPTLRRRARAAMLEALRDTDAAQLLLATTEDSGRVAEEVRFQVESAVPRLPVPTESLRLLTLVPPGTAGAAVQDLVAQAAQGAVDFGESEGDLIFCQESSPLAVPELTAALVGNRAAYTEAAQRVLTRTDVAWMGLRTAPDLTAVVTD